ncbi:hydroxymethylglutaryl-CoA lyase [Leucobacter aridicollis]
MTDVRALGLPARVSLPSGPDAVEVWEMAPRDGLQAESRLLGIDERVELIERLAGAGCPIIEVGSFVRPDRVPAMAGSDEVLRRVAHLDVRKPVLVPNLRGYELARAAGATEIAVFLSVTESFSQSNLGASRETMEAAAAAVVARAVADGVRVRGYLSMVFGDPWEGPVSPREVLGLAQRMRAFGVSQLSLGDTIGVATPGQVTEVVRTLTGEGVPVADLALHMHDTYGQALANVAAGLAEGIRVFDSSAGGVGGCPFARSATGNLATDDLLWMLMGMGIQTGINLDALTEASSWLSATLRKPPTSRVATALAR